MTELNLMPHQSDVLQQTNNKTRCAYYLDMGLGKTFVGSEKMKELGSKTNLVICQKSKIEDWVEHFGEYYDVNIYDLTDKSDFQQFMSNRPNDIPSVAIINYDLVFRRPWLLTLRDFTLMLDESSLICNEKAKRSKFILKMQPDNVILLSGTPTAGKYEQLWSQLRLLGWKISKTAYWNSYVDSSWVDICGFKREVIHGYKNVDHLKRKLAEHGAVFMKTEEVIELPEQIEQKIYLHPTTEYKYFIKNNYLMLDTLNLHQFKDCSDFYGTDVTPRVELIGDNSLTKTLYARQLCGQYHKEKLDAFKDLLQSTEDRLIVFYNFNEELERLRKICKGLNRPISYVNGSGRDLTAYNNQSNSILFIQYQAGAMGGNFQKANKIIYYTLPLGKGSCDLWEQSKKRIHRIGQSKSCFYYYLLVEGSFEEKNYAALQEGKELTDELFKD